MLIVVAALLFPLAPAGVVPVVVVAVAAPPGIQQCSKVEFRQTHLAECNQQGNPFLIGGSGGGDGGLIGALGRALHSLTGL